MNRRPPEALVCIGLGLLCFVAFHSVVDNGFVSIDDHLLVVDNPFVNSGLRVENIRWAFTTVHASNWAPLAWLSHMLDCTLFGLDPRPHHVVNLVLHALNTIMLFLVLRRMTAGAPGPGSPDSLWPSALVAALFAVHPAHVQSVAWIAERRDVLSTAFWILAMGAYTAYVRQPDSRRASRCYGATCAFLALGLMAKPMLVTLPFVFLLLDYWPLRRIQLPSAEGQAFWRQLRPLLVEKLPLFALIAAACGITLFAQSSGGSVESLDVFPFGERVANALVSCARYLRMLVWPFGLAVYYPRPSSEALSVGWRVLGSGALLLGITLLVLRYGRAHRYLPVGWFWFLGTLVPVIGLVQIGLQALADRYTYVPYIGLFIALAWGAAELASRSRTRAIALGLAAGVAIAAFAVLTWRQVGYWKDSYTLWAHAIAVTEDNATAYNQLFDLNFRAQRFEEALRFGERSLAIRPDSVPVLNNLGNALSALHRTKEAEVLYARALAQDPAFGVARLNLAMALRTRGANSEAVSLLADAFDAKRPAIASRLARVYMQSLRDQLARREVSLERAASDYRRAMDHFPERRELVDEFGWILATHPNATPDHGREALELERARRVAEKSLLAVDLDRLAVVYAAAGHFDEAVAAAEHALELSKEGGAAFLLQEVRKRLALYRSGRPYRDNERWGPDRARRSGYPPNLHTPRRPRKMRPFQFGEGNSP